MTQPDPTLASARPDPRAGEDGEPWTRAKTIALAEKILLEAEAARDAAYAAEAAANACTGCADLERRLRAAEAENDDLRRHIERRAAGTDPLADHLRAKAEAAEVERDAHKAEAERLRNRLHDPKGTSRELERFCREVHRDVLCECGHVAEVHTVRVGLHGHYERCCTDRACGCDEFVLARASQGDPATGPRSVPRPTEEERG